MLFQTVTYLFMSDPVIKKHYNSFKVVWRDLLLIKLFTIWLWPLRMNGKMLRCFNSPIMFYLVNWCCLKLCMVWIVGSNYILLVKSWLWKEPLWSRRFEQYTLLVFRRMLDYWWCWGLSRAGGMHIWVGRIQVVFARWCVRVGCWLDVCAMECVSVVVSCCWKGGLE